MTVLDPPLGEAHELLRATSERFIRSRWPMERVRAFAEGSVELDAGYLRQAGELGWFAMLVPEEYGGGSVSGEGIVDAAVIATQRGRDLQPGPFVPTNVAADTLAREGSEEHRRRVLPAIARGEALVTWAMADPCGSWEAGRGVRWSPEAAGFVLRGTAALVEDAHLAGWLLVTAGSDVGISQFLVATDGAGVRIERSECIDVSRRFYQVAFEDVRVPRTALVGGVGTGAESVDRQLQVAAVLTVAEMVGAMERDLSLAVAYAKDRVAFGRPIGSFQAVKHLLADTSLLLEASKALAAAAARAVADGVDAAELCHVAKAYVGDSAVALGQNCFQVFAGIGFTWDHDQHFYLRRLTLDAMLYGEPDWHREQICDVYGLHKVDR